MDKKNIDKIKIGINGFGRIGRTLMRVIQNRQDIEVVAINDLADPATLAHLLKYDSIHGQFRGIVAGGKNKINVKGNSIRIFEEKDPEKIPWGIFGADIVVECTGRFLDEVSAGKHLIAGAKKVILSAPAKGSIKTIVIGVNDEILNGSDLIVSNASCTTNNAAPMIKILEESWGIEGAYITTVHAYTGDQSLHDAPHRDLRRSRAAAVSIIPTTTGAAKAVTEIFPKLKGKIGGAGIRVPVINGSLTDLTCILKKSPPTVEQINKAFKEASEFGMKEILQYTDEPIVSVDIIGNTHSCIFDSQLSSVQGHMVKVVGWYDNEMGYAARLADLVVKMANA